ncbi:MAG: hypothetical protein QM831_06560 [Kofleriaceae bacterium]
MGTIGDYAAERELPGPPGEACYETTHKMLPRRARMRVAKDLDAGKRLMREACILEALRHNGVPRVFEIGIEDGLPWIADELIVGQPLSAPIAVNELATVLRETCTILAHVHRRGVIHDGIWLDAFVRVPERGLCLANWRRARLGDPAEGREDVHALAMAIYAALPGSAPVAIMELLEKMLAPVDRLTAQDVVDQATHLGETLGFDDPDIEEVVLLEDLSRDVPAPVPAHVIGKPKWTPAPPITETMASVPLRISVPKPA